LLLLLLIYLIQSCKCSKLFCLRDPCILRDVVDQQGADGTAVVAAGDGPEVLLPSGVPDLELDHLAGDLEHAGGELDADGDFVGLVDLLLHELHDE